MQHPILLFSGMLHILLNVEVEYKPAFAIFPLLNIASADKVSDTTKA